MNFLPAQSEIQEPVRLRYLINLDYVMYFIDQPGGQLTAVMRDGAHMVVERFDLVIKEMQQK